MGSVSEVQAEVNEQQQQTKTIPNHDTASPNFFVIGQQLTDLRARFKALQEKPGKASARN